MSERDDAAVVRSEEELAVRTEESLRGAVRARKRVETHPVEAEYGRDVEHVDDLEHVPAADGDSGEIETWPDGSVSIPVFEERLVVTKELVVRERVVIRKRTVTESERIETQLRRERVEVEGDIEAGGAPSAA